jgi:hypothetical protein
MEVEAERLPVLAEEMVALAVADRETVPVVLPEVEVEVGIPAEPHQAAWQHSQMGHQPRTVTVPAVVEDLLTVVRINRTVQVCAVATELLLFVLPLKYTNGHAIFDS